MVKEKVYFFKTTIRERENYSREKKIEGGHFNLLQLRESYSRLDQISFLSRRFKTRSISRPKNSKKQNF